MAIFFVNKFKYFYQKVLTFDKKCSIIISRKGEIDRDKGQKGDNMEGMTDLQFKAFLKSILEILESSKDLEEAKSKIKALLNEIQ